MACTVTVKNGELPQEEIDAYIARATDKYGRALKSIEITADGDYVDLIYRFEPIPFHRIRRITGYLVGNLDRFNDAKRAEVDSRVKHSISCGMDT